MLAELSILKLSKFKTLVSFWWIPKNNEPHKYKCVARRCDSPLVCIVRDKHGTEFLVKWIHEYFSRQMCLTKLKEIMRNLSIVKFSLETHVDATYTYKKDDKGKSRCYACTGHY